VKLSENCRAKTQVTSLSAILFFPFVGISCGIR